MMARSQLYHLTPTAKSDAILKEGINADEEGYIYLFTDMIVANTIARDQVFCREYSVFRIEVRGVHAELEPDDVAEYSRRYLRRVRQAIIEPKHLKHIKDCVVEHLDDWDLAVNRAKGIPDEASRAMAELDAWMDEQRELGRENDPDVLTEAQRRFDEINVMMQQR